MKQTFLALVLCAGPVLAGLIRVPSQQPTVQAGLNAAGSDDTVLVAPGTYGERLVWPAVDGIVLASEFGADTTTIDANQAGRVLTMSALDYTSATLVEGFRITGGWLDGSGAGVHCRGAPVFLENQIVDNYALGNQTGGGVLANGAPVFGFNLIARDSIRVFSRAGFRYGGGVYCTGSGVFYGNVFTENAISDSGCSGFRYGGALYLSGGSPLVFNNLFLRNAARMNGGSGFSYGAGVYVGNAASAYIANNTFVGNVCAAHVTYGAAAWVPFGSSVVKNNIMVENNCLGSGHGGGIASDTLGMVVDYNDVWQNYPDNYYECTAGPNSLSLDPLFADAPFGDFCLSQVAAGQAENSPCLDAGDTLLATVPLDLDSLIHAWTTRTDSAADAGVPDMGFHYRVGPMTPVDPKPVPRGSEPWLHLAPNPANRGEVRVVGSRGTRVGVFDALGRRVCCFTLSSLDGRAALDVATLGAGVYLVRSDAGSGGTGVRLVVAP